MINRKREGYQSASPQHSLMHTFSGLKSVTLARENQSRLSWDSGGMLISLCLFNQNTPLLQLKGWSGLQNCQYINLIHCDIRIPPKGSSVNTEGSEQGKKGSFEGILSNLPTNCTNGDFLKTVQGDFSISWERSQVRIRECSFEPWWYRGWVPERSTAPIKNHTTTHIGTSVTCSTLLQHKQGP